VVTGRHDAHLLYRPGDSPVHRLAPEVKIAAAVGFTIAVVSTPRTAFWAFGAYAGLLGLVAVAARIPPGWLLRRAGIELPFVALAFALPFLAAGERVRWAGLWLSVEGLLGGWNILAKATLGLLASLLLIGTTPVRDLILGLDRLRCPPALTQIATFMLRYLDVLAGEARRMRLARIARGDDPRFLWQLRGFAAGLGALFLRGYERGERVWLAMRARGWTGTMPAAWTAAGAGSVRQWSVAATVPAVAVLVAVAARVVT
jgi:cobalt/nickel transport system permease protein